MKAGSERVSGSQRSNGGLGPWPLDVRTGLECFAVYTVLSLLGLLLGWILLGPIGGGGLLELDRTVVVEMAEVRSEDLTTMTDIASGFSDTITMVIALPVVMGLLAAGVQRWREPLTLGLAVGLEAAVFLTVSTVVGRGRPPVDQLDPAPPTAAFPSGHTGAAAAFYFGLALVVFWYTGRRVLRVAGTVLAATVTLAVMAARVYRGMHFPSDVIVGLLLGLACLVVAATIVERALRRRAVEGG